MIPINSISRHQQGQVNDKSAPKINLGSSLSRLNSTSGVSKAAPLSSAKVAQGRSRNIIRRVITARRISDLFLNLPKISEGGSKVTGTSHNRGKDSLDSLQSSSDRPSWQSLNRDDLRKRRQQLRDMGVNRRMTGEDGNGLEPKRRFYRLVRVLQIIVRMYMSMKKYMKEEMNTNWSLLEMTLNIRSYFDRLLSFRPAEQWTGAAQHSRLATVLRVPGRLRSDEHIKTIKALLRGHTAFEDYPDHIKDQLAQICIFQRYHARRVITRIGHTPTAFYLILAGSVLINVMEVSEKDNQKYMTTVNQISQGEAFGEVGLITGCKRAATIICKTDVELLIVEKKDFDKIIKGPLQRQRDTHVDFIEKMELFRHFPCDVLVENSQDFFYQYFRSNTVILTNSVESDYLVVVKRGKCRAVAAYDQDAGPKKKPKSLINTDLEFRFPLYSAKLKRQTTDIDRRDVSQLENTAAMEMDVKAKGGLKINDKLEAFNQRFPGANVPAKAKTRRRSNSLTGFYDVMETRRKESKTVLPSFWAEMLNKKPPGPRRMSMKAISEEQKNVLKLPKSRAHHSARNLNSRRDSVTKVTRYTGGAAGTWKRLAALAARRHWDRLQEKPMHYAQLAEFNEGNVFGLETLLQRDSTSEISLISDGAECLFVSKKLFLEHANAKVLRVVSDLVVTYPSSDFIGTYIRRQKKWENYKDQLIQKRAK